MSRRPLMLVVDDDADIRSALRAVLGRAGMDVVEAANGASCLDVLGVRDVDLVLLDVAMPGLDGVATLGRIRETSDVLVLMLTARAERHDKLRGLGGGADDYVTKPFDNAELVARVRALLRRRTGGGSEKRFDDGVLAVDFGARTVEVEGRLVELAPAEWNLLVALVRNRGRTLTKQELLELAWHDPLGVGPERVKYTALRLRARLGLSDPATSPVEAVRGVGYRYRAPTIGAPPVP